MYHHTGCRTTKHAVCSEHRRCNEPGCSGLPSTQRQLTDILSHRLDRKEPHRCRPAYRSAIRGRLPRLQPIHSKRVLLFQHGSALLLEPSACRSQHEPWDKQKAPITPFVQPLRLPDSVCRGPVVRSHSGSYSESSMTSTSMCRHEGTRRTSKHCSSAGASTAPQDGTSCSATSRSNRGVSGASATVRGVAGASSTAPSV